MGTFLTFDLRPRPAGRKTEIWNVLNSADRDFLGTVAWYAPWRRYVFRPWVSVNVIFDASCLREIAAFIAAQMAERKKA